MSIQNIPNKYYHGTTFNNLNLINVDEIDCEYQKVHSPRRRLDFGPGFYLTSFKDQAIEHALKKMGHYNRDNKRPTQALVIEYELNKESYLQMKTNELILMDTNKEWAEFVLNNRAKKIIIPNAEQNRNGKFDVVYGPLADGYIGSLVSEYEDEEITFDDFHKGIIFNDSEMKDQLSIHNNDILRNVLKYTGHKNGIHKSNFR